MKTATQLRRDLSEIFDQLKSGQIELKQAAELSNIAGKMISSAKVQVEYYALTGEKPSIAFLNEEKG